MIGIFLQLINLILWGVVIISCVYIIGLVIAGTIYAAYHTVIGAFSLTKTIIGFIFHFFRTILFEKPLS